MMQPLTYGGHRTTFTADLQPGDTVRVKQSKAKNPPRAPSGALLRHRYNLMRPYGLKLTIRSIRGLDEPPAIPGYWDLEHAEGRIVEVAFDDGSVAFAPLERCAWWTT